MIKKYQYNILSFYLTRSLIVGNTLSLLIKTSKNNILLSSIFGTLIGLFIIHLFYKKNRINKIINLILSICSLFITILTICTLTNTYLLNKTPLIIVLLTLIILLLFCSNKKIEIISNNTSLNILITIVFTILFSIGLISILKISNILPLFNTSIYNFIKASFLFAFVTSAPNILLLNYKSTYNYNDLIKGYIFGCLFIIGTLFFIISIYGYKLATIIRFPEYNILKKINLLNTISNIENIFILEWIISVIISSIFFLHILKNNLNKKIFYLTFLLIIITIIIIINNHYLNLIYINNYNSYIFGIIIILSLLLPKDKNVHQDINNKRKTFL